MDLAPDTALLLRPLQLYGERTPPVIPIAWNPGCPWHCSGLYGQLGWAGGGQRGRLAQDGPATDQRQQQPEPLCDLRPKDTR